MQDRKGNSKVPNEAHITIYMNFFHRLLDPLSARKEDYFKTVKEDLSVEFEVSGVTPITVDDSQYHRGDLSLATPDYIKQIYLQVTKKNYLFLYDTELSQGEIRDMATKVDEASEFVGIPYNEFLLGVRAGLWRALQKDERETVY